MLLKNFLAALTAGIALGAASASFAPAFSDEKRAAAAADRQWLSIPQIHQKLEAAGYRNIEKIEREHGSYEVRATNRDGQRTKFYVHPQTGEVIDDRQGGRQRDGNATDQRQRAAADCNERRCRDDLPPGKAPAIGPAGK